MIETTYNYCIAQNADGDFAVTEGDSPWAGAAGTYDSVFDALSEIRRYHEKKHSNRFKMHEVERNFNENDIVITGNMKTPIDFTSLLWTVSVDIHEPNINDSMA